MNAAVLMVSGIVVMKHPPGGRAGRHHISVPASCNDLDSHVSQLSATLHNRHRIGSEDRDGKAYSRTAQFSANEKFAGPGTSSP